VSTYAFPNRYRVEYLEALISFVGAPFDKAFLLSAGTEATDASLKLMRLYAQSKGRGKTVVAVHGNWHGRTMGAQKLSSNSLQSDWIIGRDMAIEHMAFPYPWDVTEDTAEEFLLTEITRLEQSLGLDFRTDVCGVMLESFQGWGAFFYPKSYVQALRNFCNENSVLLAFDEMQAGFGRTGYKFGFEHYGVVPDLFACGKGMGGGFPISGVIGRGEIMDLPATGEMSSTHSANPISCAAGLGVIESLLLDNLIDESRRKGQIMCAQLDEIRACHPDVVRCTSSQGLIGAIVFHEQINDVPGDLLASEICIEAMRRGVLVVRTGRESIKLGPPLVIEDEALVEGLTVLAECLDQTVARLIS
jgi:4-aminobutyrate aminotransferase-like enzyme